MIITLALGSFPLDKYGSSTYIYICMIFLWLARDFRYGLPKVGLISSVWRQDTYDRYARLMQSLDLVSFYLYWPLT